ncbi:RlmE family RNA methyltransferase [Accumulibacter sp.]|uniref:RlmE family RNA methyltransferase n=1 Tax=Accumulibacter sp. TaxID=2053492 RepID=UPI0025F932F2|nr:RlmE family RNA methyltransferase [Accumulibacter sp.]MCM8613935.1 RlmE family RNA methyltransferase [Accumulibacter sp.]MCM8637678.1 RlmE family RNA methyltransferase [Accumulibacter sp.]MCM8641108.1 RlmE family RNA methyltransferase [Accumulibacter sp.]
MKRSRSSNAWLREHVSDSYVQRARAEGYRSRAAYKLLQIDDREHLIRPGDLVVDLGASPGGWSQVVAKRQQGRGRVIAVDILPMEQLPGVIFLPGDFREVEVLDRLRRLLKHERAGLVLCDMSPNISGISLCDQAQGMHLSELALDFASQWLQPDGCLLVKVFQGLGFDDFLHRMRQTFRLVCLRKPDASRDRSREVYLLGRGLQV